MMIDLLCMCTLVMFLVTMIVGIILWLVFSSWDLFAVSVAGMVVCWLLLCVGRD